MFDIAGKKRCPLYFVPVMCLLGCFFSCKVHGTKIPGDKRAFDPVANLQEVKDFAGGNPVLLKIIAYFVRPDGTVDFKAQYVNKGQSLVIYEFVRDAPPTGERANKKKEKNRRSKEEPIGVRPQQKPEPGQPQYEYVRVFIYKPYMNSYEDSSDEIHRGMEKATAPMDNSLKEEQVPSPSFNFKEIWNRAENMDIPLNAVAMIVYDVKGYFFSINYTDHSYRFTHGGELAEE